MAFVSTSEELIKFFESVYPNIRLFAAQRMTSGKNLYNAKTHKVKPPIRDNDEAGAVLLVVEKILREQEKQPQFSRDEQKRLDKIGLDFQHPYKDNKNPLKPLLALLIPAFLLLFDVYDRWQ